MSKDEDTVNEPGTKGDLASLRKELTLTFDTKLETVQDALSERIESVRDELSARMESMKDQIIRAFRMTEENIRKDSAHVDEVADLDNRVSRIERHVGLSSD